MRNTILRRCTLFLMGVLASTAYAETLSVQVPFAFAAAGKRLPAGTYTVDSVASGVVMIRGASAAESAAVQAYSSETMARAAKPSLIFLRSSDMPVLSGVNTESGMIFTIPPDKRVPVAPALRAKGTAVLSHP